MTTATAGVTFGRLITDALGRFADRPAFVQDDRTYSYAQTADLVGRMRAVLAARGVGRGSGVAVLSPNRAEAWMAEAAVWIAGGRYSGLHHLGSEDDHVYLCDDAEIVALVADPGQIDRAAAVAARSSSVEHLFTLGPAAAGEDLMALCRTVGAPRLDPGPAGEDDTCFLQYTGGTTGRPKGVMVPHRAMVQTALSWLSACEVPERPRYLATSPITHAALLPVLPTLIRGGTVVLHQAFDPQRWLSTVQRERINYAFVVPSMIYSLLDNGRPEAHDLSSLETVVYAAAPILPTRLEEGLERMGPVFHQFYGQAESMAPVTTLLKDEHDAARRPGLLTSCGRPAPGYDVAILDEANNEVPRGEIGEICVRSRGVMTGYWKQPELTEAAFAGGWLHTSDLGHQDDRGYLHIVDRKKDMVISGGFNIYPKEIEDVLDAHPSVAVVAVIGVPDPKWGEAVTALVVPRPGTTVVPAELIELVKQKKGSAHAPKVVDIVDELPLTALGKVDKLALRATHGRRLR